MKKYIFTILGLSSLMGLYALPLSSNLSGVEVADGENKVISGKEISSTEDNKSPVLVKNGAKVSLNDVTVTSDAEDANAVFALGKGSEVKAKNIKISTSKDSSRGLYAMYDGTIHAENVDVETQGAHCAAFATDRGEGTVSVNGGSAKTHGQGSPVIYSTGDISVKNLQGSSQISEIAVIEGKNRISLNKVHITGGKNAQGGESGCAVMLYQSMSGDADSGKSVFTASDSILTSTSDGPFFYITNTKTEINLNTTKIENPGKVFLLASGNESERGWGRRGANGGFVILNTENQILEGDISADAISSVQINFGFGTEFTGSMNKDIYSNAVNLKLDKAAKITLTADSYLNEFITADKKFKNINSNGFTLYYNKKAKANDYLKGKNYNLKDGGKIVAIEMQDFKVPSCDEVEEADRGTRLPDHHSDNLFRPEIKSFFGKLHFVGKEDTAAELTCNDGSKVILCLMKEVNDERMPPRDRPEGKNGEMKGPDGKAEMPPEGFKDMPERKDKDDRRQPPKRLTLDDLKKFDEKTVEVMGFSVKNGKIIVVEIKEK